MSQVIDEKVVEMRFDNRQFETNVKTSLSTIDKLKSSLDFNDTVKGFDDLNNAAKKCNLSGLSNAVETVKTKFSVLEVMAVTAIANITNSAVNSGRKLISSLSIDQIAKGWSKYADKTSAVQTIMAATAKDFSNTAEQMEYVNTQLDKLNWFTDETSYSFLDMVSNIGKFTSNNISLEKSVGAMEGISTWAALSGANIGEASRAMYNLSQAIAVGSVKLIDWKSIENANMATSEFKQTAIDTAVAMGTLKANSDGTFRTLKGNIVTVANFNEALSDAWFTSDVLLSTLDQYGGFANKLYEASEAMSDQYSTVSELLTAIDKYKSKNLDVQEVAKNTGLTVKQVTEWFDELSSSTYDLGRRSFVAAQEAKTFQEAIDSVKEAVSTGWMNTFELIFGDYKEAKVLWTDIANSLYDVFASGAAARNRMLSTALNTGWSNFLKEGVTNAAAFKQSIYDAAIAHGVAMESIVASSENFEDSLKQGWLSSEIIADALDTLIDKTKGLSDEELKNIGCTSDQVEAFAELSESIKNGSVDLEEYSKQIGRLSGRENIIKSFWNVWNALFADSDEQIGIITAFRQAFKEIIPPMTSEKLYAITENIRKFTEKLKMSEETVDKVKRSFKGFFAVIDILATLIKDSLNVSLDLLGFLFGKSKDGVLGFTASIGDSLVAVRDWIKEHNFFLNTFKKITNAIKFTVIFVKEFIKAVGELPQVKSAFTFISTLFSNIGNVIKDVKDRIADFLKDFSFTGLIATIKDFKENVIDYIANSSDAFKNIKVSLKGIKQSFKETFSNIGKTITNAKNNVVSTFQSVVSFLEKIKDKIFKFVFGIREKLNGSIGAGDILGFGISIATLVSVQKMIKAFEKVASGFTNMLKSAAGALDSVSSYFKSKSLNEKSKALIGIAGAILMLVAALGALVYLAGQPNFGIAIATLAGLAVSLSLLMLALSKLGPTSANIKITVPILSIAASLLILSKAIKELQGFDITRDYQSLILVIGLLGSLVAATKLLGSKEKRFNNGVLSIVAMAIAIKKLAETFQTINKIKIDNTKKVATIFIGIGALITTLTLVSKNAKAGFGIGLLAAAASVHVLLIALNKLSMVDTNAIHRNMTVISKIFGLFAIIIASSFLAGENIGKAGSGLIKMSAAVIIIIGAIKMLSKADSASMKPALKAISNILIIFGAITALSLFAGENAKEAGKMLLMMSGAIAIISAVMGILSIFDPEKLNNALTTVSILLGIFGAIIAISALAKDKTQVKMISAMTVAVVALSASAIALSLIDKSSLMSASAALSIMLVSFGAVIAFAKKNGTKSTKSLWSLIAITAALSALLVGLSALKTQNALKNAAALSLLLTALSIDLKILATIQKQPNAGVLGALALISLISTIPGLVLAGMSALDTKNAIENAVGLSILISALAGAAALLTVAGTVGAKAALIGILAITAMLLALGGLAALAIEVTKDVDEQTLKQGLDKAILIADSLGKMLGSFVGSLVGNLTAGPLLATIETLPVLGDAIAQCIDSIGSSIGSIGSMEINPDVVDSVAKMLSVITGLFAVTAVDGLLSANPISMLSKLLTGDKTSVSSIFDEVEDLAKVCVKLSKKASGIDISNIRIVGEASGIVLSIAAAIPTIGGMLNALVGETDLKQFGTSLESFGNSVITFAETAKGIEEYSNVVSDSEIIEKAVDPILNIADAMPRVGGKIQDLIGEKDLEQFGTSVSSFGSSIILFAETVKAIDNYPNLIDNAETIGEAVDPILKIVDAIPRIKGFVQDLIGEKDLEQFGTSICNFATSVITYAETIKSISEHGNVVENADIVYKATAGLAAISSFISPTGGLVSLFVRQDISTFGKKVSLFGEYIADYANAISGIETSTKRKSEAVVYVLNTLVGASSEITIIGGLSNLLPKTVDFERTLDKLADEIIEVMLTAAKIKEKIGDKGLTSNNAEALRTTIKKNCSLIKVAHERIAEMYDESMDMPDPVELRSFVNKLSKSIASIIEISTEVSSLSDDSITGFTCLFKILEKIREISEIVKDLGDVFESGNSLVSISDSIVSFAQNIFRLSNTIPTKDSDRWNELATTINAMMGSFASLHVEDFAKAIDDKSQSITSISSKIEEYLLSGLKDVSTSFYSVGENVVDGLVKGISDNLHKVSTSGVNIGSRLLKGTKGSLKINSPSKEMESLGKYTGEGFINGVSSSLEKVGAISEKIGSGSVKTEMVNAGKSLGQRLSDGISLTKTSLWETVTGIFTPKDGESSIVTDIVDFGKGVYGKAKEKFDNLDDGLIPYVGEVITGEKDFNIKDWLGIPDTDEILGDALNEFESFTGSISSGANNTTKTVTQSAKSAFEEFKEYIDEEKHYSRITAEEEIAAYENVLATYKLSADEKKEVSRQIYSLQSSLFYDQIEEEKYYNRLSLQDEYNMYAKRQELYRKDTEEWKKLEREKYRVKKELEDASYQHSMDWIEKEKYYNRLSLVEELAAYTRVQNRYKKGTEERKKLDQEVYRLTKEIYEAREQYLSDIEALEKEAAARREEAEQEYADNVRAINEQLAKDIESENNRYLDALESRSNELYKSYGLFDEVEKKETADSSKLMANLEDQVKEFEEWQDVLTALSGRGVDEDLIKELQEMGPSAIAQIKALNSMSDNELDKYVSLWGIKHAQAKSQAISELEGLREETLDNISKLREQADEELEKYKLIWQEKLAEINDETNEKLNDLREEFGKAIGLIKDDTVAEFEQMTKIATEVLLLAGWDETGKQIVKGLIEGINAESPEFIDAINKLTNSAVETAEDNLEINSPSKVFFKIGQFVGHGFINGIASYKTATEDTVSTLTASAESGAYDIVQSISEIISSGVDDGPVITPVVDLSKVTQSVNDIDGLFAAKNAVNLAYQNNTLLSRNWNSDGIKVTVNTDKIEQEIRALRTDLSAMSGEISRLKIVMDTGTLIGEITDPIDVALAQKYSNKGRGI